MSSSSAESVVKKSETDEWAILRIDENHTSKTRKMKWCYEDSKPLKWEPFVKEEAEKKYPKKRVTVVVENTDDDVTVPFSEPKLTITDEGSPLAHRLKQQHLEDREKMDKQRRRPFPQ